MSDDHEREVFEAELVKVDALSLFFTQPIYTTARGTMLAVMRGAGRPLTAGALLAYFAREDELTAVRCLRMLVEDGDVLVDDTGRYVLGRHLREAGVPCL